jgi:non-specific serine/threonine protein kinase
MGLIEVARANYSRATEVLQEALSVAREADDKNIIQLTFFGLASVAARRGQPGRAAQLWGASEAVREAFDMQLSPMTRAFAGYEDNVEAASSELAEVTFEEAWAVGKAMVQQQAVEYALSEEETYPPTISVSEEPSADEPTGELTHREQEVAVLVARSLTNRQIAVELTLSEHTIATHIRNILKKLGLNSRNQIAAWFTEQR